MLISKETLIDAVALGAGAATAKVVQRKLIDQFLPGQSELTKNFITLGIGILTPTIVRGRIAAAYGGGMVAASVAGLIDPVLTKAGLQGVNDVMMGEIAPSNDTPMMGTTATIFNSPVNDFTQGAAGEMDF